MRSASDRTPVYRLWLVTARDPALVDFDKTLATSERLDEFLGAVETRNEAAGLGAVERGGARATR